MGNCILCDSANLEKKSVIKSSDIIKLYRKSFSINISELIKCDISLIHCLSCDLIFYDPPATGDENFYNEFQKFPWYYEDDKQEFHWAAAHISESASVLEVGAGRGAFSRRIPGRHYTGLDFSSGAQKLAANSNIEIQLVAIEDWADLHPEKYDVVCHFQVLEHISEPAKFLQACVKALRPGGKLLISVPSEDSYIGVLGNQALNMPPHHVTRWSDAALEGLGDLLGCRVETIDHDFASPSHRLTLTSTALRELWFGTSAPIDLSFGNRLKGKIARHVAQILKLDQLDPMFLGRGHTVKACYIK